MSEMSATQWRASVEYVLGEKDDPNTIMVKRIIRDLNLNLDNELCVEPKFSVGYLATIRAGHGSRVIYSYIVRIHNMWAIRAPKVTQFHNKQFRELLDDVYQNSVYKPGFIQGQEKHSFNTVHVLSEMDKRGVCGR